MVSGLTAAASRESRAVGATRRNDDVAEPTLSGMGSAATPSGGGSGRRSADVIAAVAGCARRTLGDSGSPGVFAAHRQIRVPAQGALQTALTFDDARCRG